MNKVSLVTLWVDPAEHQILRYEFRNIDMDFLPGRSLVRIDGMRATMQMGEPFPSVWLPASVGMRFRMTPAAGPFEGTLRREVHATTGCRRRHGRVVDDAPSVTTNGRRGRRHDNRLLILCAS